MTSIIRQGAVLAFAKYADQVIMLLTPVVLVRTITAADFGEYRLFWLLVNTVALLAPLGMPRSLLYFFPRLSTSDQKLFIGQTVIFMVATTLLSILCVFVFKGLFPSGVQQILANYGFVISLFMLAWVVGSLIDFLPSATNNVHWQANATIVTSILRGFLVVGAALKYQSLYEVLLATLVAAIIRFGFLSYFVLRRTGITFYPIDNCKFTEQVQYGVPFGLVSLLYNMRKQAEQWIVAALFTPLQFGVFSIAATLSMPFELLRGVLANLLLPKMSNAQMGGRHSELLELNCRGNLIVSAVIFPWISALFFFSEDVIELLFTAEFIPGANVLRVYLFQAAIAVDLATLMNVFALGSFNLHYTVVLLPLSIGLSYAGSSWFGLMGAAIGSVIATVLGYAVTLWKLSVVTDQPISVLQDWGNMGKLLLLAIISGVCGFLIINGIGVSLSLRAFGGPAIVVGMYSLLFMMFGYHKTILNVGK